MPFEGGEEEDQGRERGAPDRAAAAGAGNHPPAPRSRAAATRRAAARWLVDGSDVVAGHDDLVVPELLIALARPFQRARTPQPEEGGDVVLVFVAGRNAAGAGTRSRETMGGGRGGAVAVSYGGGEPNRSCSWSRRRRGWGVMVEIVRSRAGSGLPRGRAHGCHRLRLEASAGQPRPRGAADWQHLRELLAVRRRGKEGREDRTDPRRIVPAQLRHRLSSRAQGVRRAADLENAYNPAHGRGLGGVPARPAQLQHDRAQLLDGDRGAAGGRLRCPAVVRPRRRHRRPRQQLGAAIVPARALLLEHDPHVDARCRPPLRGRARAPGSAPVKPILVYAPGYDLALPGFDQLHPFDGRKYSRAWTVIRERLGPELERYWEEPREPASDADLLRVHTKENLASLASSSVVA